MPNFMTIFPVGAEFFHADSQTDREKARQWDKYEEANNHFS